MAGMGAGRAGRGSAYAIEERPKYPAAECSPDAYDECDDDSLSLLGGIVLFCLYLVAVVVDEVKGFSERVRELRARFAKLKRSQRLLIIGGAVTAVLSCIVVIGGLLWGIYRLFA